MKRKKENKQKKEVLVNKEKKERKKGETNEKGANQENLVGIRPREKVEKIVKGKKMEETRAEREKQKWASASL